ILPSAIGMNKLFQKNMMQAAGMAVPRYSNISRQAWLQENQNAAEIFSNIKAELGNRFVVKPANQGSSVGVSIVNENDDVQKFSETLNKAFFIQKIENNFWKQLSNESKISFIRSLTDIREGIGFPLKAAHETLYHPEDLLSFIEKYFSSEVN